MEPQYILMLVVVLVMGWFAAGLIYNLRRGDAYLHWLQSGLPQVGEKTTFRWLGSSVAELVIAQAKKPFKRMEIMFVLAPRDVPWMWLLAMYRGRKDTLILRSHLSITPKVDLELADPTSWTGRMALHQAAQRGWVSQSFQGMQLMTPPGLLNLATKTLEALTNPIRELTSQYWRISLRRSAPHLELHIAFPDRQIDSQHFIDSLRTLASTVGDVQL